MKIPATARQELWAPYSNSQILVTTPGDEDAWRAAADLLSEYLRWLAPLAGVEGESALRAWARTDPAELAETYRRPGHEFLVAGSDGDSRICAASGIVGLRPTEDPATVELVRFYCRPEAQRSGVGAALMSEAENRARRFGYRRLVLDTSPAFMEAAVRLYLRRGFRLSQEPHRLPIEQGARYELDL